MTADLWALADRPAPDVIPGQLAVPDGPRPVVAAGPPEALFGIEDIPRRSPAPQPTARRTDTGQMTADEYRQRLMACGNTPHMVDTIIGVYTRLHPVT